MFFRRWPTLALSAAAALAAACSSPPTPQPVAPEPPVTAAPEPPPPPAPKPCKALDEPWQAEGAARGTKKGPLLIFADTGKEGDVLLGLGFVPDDDSSGADAAILASIESIAVAGE